MAEIQLSIVTLTKKREQLFSKHYKAIWGLAHDTSNIEHIVLHDYDDLETIKYLADYQTLPYNIRTIAVTPPQNQPKNLHKDFWNVGVLLAHGSYIWMIPDDCEILSSGYDSVLYAHIEHFLLDKPDRICYTHINDDSENIIPETRGYAGKDIFCCVPVFTREVVLAIGCLMPTEITSHGNDIATYNIFSSIYYPRILDIQDHIRVKHHSIYTGTYHIDASMSEMPKSRIILNGDEYAKYITKLNNYIQACQ